MKVHEPPDCGHWQKFKITISEDTLVGFIPTDDNLPISAQWESWFTYCPRCGKPAKEVKE